MDIVIMGVEEIKQQQEIKNKTGDKKYDVIIFGASGFTGQYVVEEMARTVDEEKGVKWAVAGRDMKKLQDVLSVASAATGRDLTELPIVIADVKNDASLLAMCKDTRIVLNCVGPYRFFGTAVVKACIESGTHHIDICGEPEWLEKIYVTLNSKAKEAGVYLLQACGFDSVPAEMGLLYTSRQFKGDLNSVESYISLKFGKSGARFNSGTWLSAVHSLANRSELKAVREQLFTTSVPKSKHKQARRPAIFYSNDVKSWCMPFLGTDKSIVNRSTYVNYLERKKRPIQFQPYSTVSGFIEMGYLMLVGLIMMVFSKFKFGVQLLEKFPGLMSLGLFSSQGPPKYQIEEGSFDMTFVGLGYSDALDDPEKEHKSPPDQKIVTRVSGPEAAYFATPICIVQAAYVLLKEMDKFPKGGGVYTPGSAFPETSYLERLEKHSLKFSTLECPK